MYHLQSVFRGVRSLSSVTNAIKLRPYSCKPIENVQKNYKVVVVGGGAGGCSAAARLCRALPGPAQVAVIEPADKHYYQPLWTLVGGGLAEMPDTASPMADVLPPNCDWIQQKAESFDPDNNSVKTENGDQITYEYLVVAMGMQLNYNLIPGLREALKEDPRVCSNYDSSYVLKTYPAMQNVTEGNAIFTFPNTPIKCAGAPQKIMYLTEEYFRKAGRRDKTNVLFNTSLGVIFGVKKYAEELNKICEQRNISRNYRTNLVEVRHESNEAIFQNLDSGEKSTYNYAMLHAVPPMSSPDLLKQSPLSDQAGYLDLNKSTLQHNKYGNVFGLGDCTSLPTSKTGAAVASQNLIVVNNLLEIMQGKQTSKSYDGYTSCPLITGKGKCILAEFDYDAQPLETFPINQGKERRLMYLMKKEFLPRMYWNLMLRGRWGGPKIIRKLAHLGMSK